MQASDDIAALPSAHGLGRGFDVGHRYLDAQLMQACDYLGIALLPGGLQAGKHFDKLGRVCIHAEPEDVQQAA